MSFRTWKKLSSISLLITIKVYLVSSEIQFSRDPNDIHFYLYPFPQEPDQNQEIIYNNATTLFESAFQPNHKTVFIVHGFRSNGSSEMPQVIKDAYLSSGLNYNYIIVSWGPLSTPEPAFLTADLYFLVVGNVPIVARRVTDFIEFLSKNEYLTPEQIHMVGHSLGSHISGLTGLYLQQELKSNITRITGLDPAGPLFFPPISCRNLEATDADFVDVIHSNAGVLGDVTNDGDADFWPNGGKSQPECALNDTGIPPFGKIGFTGVCSHRFSYKLYVASFTKNLYACQCSYLSIMLQNCPADCSQLNGVLMGYDCPTTAKGDFYIRTTNPP